MGRCGGWLKIIALTLAAFTAGCGGTGGKSSDSGNPFVFQTRGRLDLITQPVPNTPTVLTIVATLLDPQGNPFRDQRVTFEAEFRDATIVPANTPQNVPLACLPPGSTGNATRCTNRGAAITDDLGQAQVTVIAGLTLGRMRITAEAPANLNISSAISVNITSQGFVGGTTLDILPTSATFINPFVNRTRGTVEGSTTFFAVGGTPPYKWENTNKDLGVIIPQGIPGINERATYTLIGPIPTDTTEALEDTIILIDSTGARVTASVIVIFADCTLQLSATDEITFDQARGGETSNIQILDGPPPFDEDSYTVTQTNPGVGTVSLSPEGVLTYTVANPPVAGTDIVTIRDRRGCVGTFTVSVTPASVETLTLTAIPATVPNTGGTVTITAVAFDGNNQPLEGATIVFSTSDGTLSAVSDETDGEGEATVTLTIPPSTVEDASTVTVTATAANAVTATTTITIQQAPPEPPAP